MTLAADLKELSTDHILLSLFFPSAVELPKAVGAGDDALLRTE